MVKVVSVFLGASVLAALLCSPGWAEGFRYPLAGVKCVVVYPKNADSREKDAAQTLAYYLGKITSVSPRCIEEAKGMKPVRNVFVGKTSAGVKALGDLKGLPDDGYKIRTMDGALYLCGPSPLGTLNAAIGLLQDKLDVIWGMPDPLWESYPHKKQIELPQMDMSCKPAYAYRTCSGVSGGTKLGELPLTYSRYIRLSDGHYEFDHNLFRIISANKYGKDHPEYFALFDGIRQVSPTAFAQPCCTNPDVLKIVVDTARKAFDDDPNLKSFSICANDNAVFCECDKCAALDSPHRTWREAKDYSGSYYHFVDQVARELMKTHPDRYILAYAYWGTVMPPRNIDKFTPNVHIAVTQDFSQWPDPEYRRQDTEMLNEWRKKVSKLSVMVYTNLGWLTPKYFPHEAGDYLRTAAGCDASSIYCDTNPNWLFQSPMVYTISRQLWDPKLDTDALLKQYTKAMFGDQAETMSRFYDLIEKNKPAPGKGKWFSGFGNWEGEANVADASLMDEAVDILRQARRDTKDHAVEKRLDWMLERIKLPLLLAQNERSIRRWANPRNAPDIDDPSYVRQAQSMIERDREAVKTAADVYMRPGMFTQGYYGGDLFWSKLRTAVQNTQYSLLAGALHSAAYGGGQPDWNETRRWLDGFRSNTDLPKHFKNRAEGKVHDAADTLTVYEALKLTPKIDGGLSDWKGCDFVELLHNPGWGKWDLPCSAAISWDENNLYVAVKVPDVKHFQTSGGPNIWNGDSVQIAIDPLDNAFEQRGINGRYDLDDIELGFALLEGRVVGWCYTKDKPEAVTGFPASITPDGQWTCYEVALPWSKITPDGRKPESMFGFNVAVNGSDGGPRRACSWTYGMLTIKEPRQFAQIILQ